MFDTTLVASNRRREARRKLATLPAALAAHGLVFGLVMVGQLWAVDQVPEVVPLTPIFVHILPPPGGGDGGRHGGQSVKHRDKPHVTPPVVQPSEVPSEVPKNPGAQPPRDDQVIGTEHRDPEEKGPEGPGLGPGPDEPPAEPPVGGPRHLGGMVVAPIPLERPAPRYPEIARRLGIQGVVTLEAVIDEQGNVTEVRVVSDPGFGCKEAALEAVRGWRYEPATLNGHRVAVYLTIRVTFQLDGVG